MIQHATTGVAVGAVTTPFWWTQLQQWSELAATILPILGAVWLGVQIVHFVWKNFR